MTMPEGEAEEGDAELRDPEEHRAKRRKLAGPEGRSPIETQVDQVTSAQNEEATTGTAAPGNFAASAAEDVVNANTSSTTNRQPQPHDDHTAGSGSAQQLEDEACDPATSQDRPPSNGECPTSNIHQQPQHHSQHEQAAQQADPTQHPQEHPNGSGTDPPDAPPDTQQHPGPHANPGPATSLHDSAQQGTTNDAQAPADATPTTPTQEGTATASGGGGAPKQDEGAAANGQAAAESADSSIAQKLPVGAYTQREEFLQNMEDAGDISFRYVLNDGDPQNMIWLIGLKNIFSKQLPNMPKEYIARLVLDRRHRSVALVRRGGTVIGGITYRVFQLQGLGEIAFCAVTASEQVKGFGTRLMNHTKEYARTMDKLSHFLTYADNNAVGYFIKQGFTKEITMDKDRWHGYIKDYDGGTLMECVLHPKVPYTQLPQMLRVQKEALDIRIRGLSRSHHVYPGLTGFSQGQRHQVPIADIPGVVEAGWREDPNAGRNYQLLLPDGRKDPTPEARHQFMALVLRELVAHDESWPFREPVDGTEVEDYYDIIRDPMDLSTMRQRLEENYYISLDMFAADFRRIVANAKTYNQPDTLYWKAGDKLEQFFHQIFNSRVDHNPIRLHTDGLTQV